MWPFTFDKGKNTDDITKELPQNLKEFFIENNPDKNNENGSVFEKSPQQQRVDNVLLKNNINDKYSYEFQKIKATETVRKVTTINCAEIQQQVLDCFRGWSFTSTNPCSDEIKLSTSCIDIQSKGLKKLHYEECYNEIQCNQIRRVIDQLFIKNFGQFGENINDENQLKFDNEIDNIFDKVWK